MSNVVDGHTTDDNKSSCLHHTF